MSNEPQSSQQKQPEKQKSKSDIPAHFTAYIMERREGAYSLGHVEIKNRRVTKIKWDEPNIQGVVIGKLEDEILRPTRK